MESIWIALSPSAESTRVLAMSDASNTILKARLRRAPSHPRAMATLLEAIALWQGRPVRAALCVDASPSGFDTSLFHTAFHDEGGPLYSVDWVQTQGARKRVRRDIGGMGAFADLRELLLCEVAR
jgi:hypothetical protein